MWILEEATSIAEYTLGAVALDLLWYSTTAYWHTTRLFSSQKIGLNRDSTSWTNNDVYNKVVAKIERFSELTHFILIKVTLIATTIPPTIATYIKYYVLGMGDASFQEFPFLYEIWSAFFPVSSNFNYGIFLPNNSFLLCQMAFWWKNTTWMFVSIISSIRWSFFLANDYPICIDIFTWLMLAFWVICHGFNKRFEQIELWTKITTELWSETAYLWHCQSVFECTWVE